ncbi:MAG TPA: hypothetical protein VGV89_03440 [Thermoplasmata archaeon]|nr:hypothetical protein [Thermoplasmata archaeon]
MVALVATAAPGALAGAISGAATAPTHGLFHAGAHESLSSRSAGARSAPSAGSRVTGIFGGSGPRLAAWGPSGAPPGAPLPLGSVVHPDGGPGGGPFVQAHCARVFEQIGGPASYSGSCYGHDEPGITFYSPLAGSAGNVSWNVTLPIDHSATANQSDLYSSVWFGMTMAAAGAWMGQCYVEVQFYPDASWTLPHGTEPDNWVGYAVGWQISTTTGTESTCFESPLYVGGTVGGGYFNMSGGDQVVVAFTGSTHSLTGENVTVRDLSNGLSSYLTLFNASGNYPINPGYSTNLWADSLPWSPGGMLPVTFAFELGHAGNSAVPSNDSFGGCAPGTPPPSPSDGAVPCPSYDPTSWANDTTQPWKISVPTFGSGATTDSPAEAAFTQGFGASAAFPTLSNTSCTGRVGSSFCSYPWFSYSCGAGAFEFGATDFAGVSNDFGQYNEYTASNSTNALGYGYYAPSNVSVPSCTHNGPSLTIDTSAGDKVAFVGSLVSNQTTFASLRSGEYRVEALAAPGQYFELWQTTGGVSVDAPASPLAVATLTNSGTLTADFGVSPNSAEVWFNGTGGVGAVALYAGTDLTTGLPLATVPSGALLNLPLGIYTVQALPPVGRSFLGFSAGSNGLTVASGSYPLTWIVVNGLTSTTSLVAAYAPAATISNLTLEGVGNGTVSLGPDTAGYDATENTSFGQFTLPSGSYPASATAKRGWTFLRWVAYPGALQTDMEAAPNLTLESGVSTLVAYFGADIKIATTPGSAGSVEINGTGPYTNGTQLVLLPGVYTIDALPRANESFSHWTDSNRSALWVSKLKFPITRLVVNSTGTLNAWFTPNPGNAVTFRTVPANGGSVTFNGFEQYSGTAVNRSVANGSYLLTATSNPGYIFAGWWIQGALVLSGGIVKVTGTGSVQANFSLKYYPITFVASPTSAVSATLNGTVLTSGQTLALPRGVYPLVASLAPNVTFASWSSALGVTATTSTSTSLNVTGPGTVAALAVPFAAPFLTATEATVDQGTPDTFVVFVNGTGPLSFQWTQLPAGCLPRDVARLSCTPSATGTFNVSVTVRGPGGYGIAPTPVTLTVVSRPTVSSFTTSLPSTDVHKTVTLRASVAAGVGPFTFAYTGLPQGCASADAATLVCTPTRAGGSQIKVSAADLDGAVAYANVTLLVYDQPNLTAVSVSPSPVTVGVAITYTASETGGSPPLAYTYTTLPSGCVTTNASALTCTPQASGTFTTTVQVIDHSGVGFERNVTLTVNPAPRITSFVASPSTVGVGVTVTFTVVATGGTGFLSTSYAGLPAGCGSANQSTITCQPTAAGTYNITVTVADRYGVGSSQSLAFTVASAGTTASGGSFNYGILALVVVAAALAGLGAALWLSRRNTSTSQPASPAPKGRASRPDADRSEASTDSSGSDTQEP